MIDLNETRSHLHKVLTSAALFLLSEQKKVQIKKYKDEVDIATTADLGAEKIIISGIQAKYPNHNIVSEEKGQINLYFSAIAEKGAWLNQKKIKVNRRKTLNRSIIYSHPPCYGKINNVQYSNAFLSLKKISKTVIYCQ